MLGNLGALPAQIQGGAQSAIDFKDFCAGNTTGSIIENCNLNTNFLGAAIGPFMFATGGYLPLIFWGVITMAIYLFYRNYLYPSIFACVTMLGTGLWLPAGVQTYIYLGLGTAFAIVLFTLIWRIPRDTA